jgi:phosphotransferase system HPr (HPr) family protein
MSATIERRFVVSTPVGLHLRPAAMLAKTADRFDSTIRLFRDGAEADAESVLSMVLLEAGYGETVTVLAKGHDAVHAMAAIGDLFEAGFGDKNSSMTT